MTVNWVTNVGIGLVNTNHENNSLLVSLIYTFSLAGNILVYTPSQGTTREKYFNHKSYKGKNADSGGK